MTQRVIDVALHIEAHIEVDETLVLPVRMRVQEVLTPLTDELLSLGAEWKSHPVLRAKVRAEAEAEAL